MLCNDVKRVVYFFLDGTLGGQKQEDLQSHVVTCPSCEARIVVHRKLRAFIVRRLSPAGAPDHFKVRLVQSLRTAQAE